MVVDRDPRDIYILSKYIWKDGIVPTEDLELFCKWFEYTRKHRKDEKYDESTTMLINFEDLVYKYPKTTTMLVEWLGLDMSHHAAPMSHFDPRKSINNTRLWEEFPEYGEEIEMIENRLKEYLYDYSGVDYEEKNSISNKSSTIF